MSGVPRVRPMSVADVEPAALAILRDDWGDRRAHLAFAATHPGIRAFVAEADGTVVGTGMATVNGPVAWIGTVWVDPGHRRHGLGRALTAAAIEAAEAEGCRTLVLVATEAGRPLYESMGFEIQTRYRILEAIGLGPDDGSPDPRIRPYRDDDLETMIALDRAATGEDRAHLLAAFASPTTARCLVGDDDRPRGFVVRAPWGGGATIAPDMDDARAILRARRLAAGPSGRVRAGLLEANVAGLERLAHDGWHRSWEAPRLVRGAPLDWRPAAIWGQFNHAMG